ncbi:DUF1871 family protein [Neobacillus sp. PS3-34]|uniref:DUF1871 family protein n=1 Tax=Neobacillus sp. PS3-34 TaxID=3070678 RepID=UPI0027DECCA1|nr:DUF1871 family protein [Neobacillus sp. PS3-34]WML46759.1 DUF1871 family protein [Neobacillus sp. PS3-34]
MIKRIFVAFISTLVFSLGLSIYSYTPESESIQGTYSFGVGATFFLNCIYITPVYLLIGVPISFMIDKWFNHCSQSIGIKTYLLKVGMYSIASLIPTIIFYFLFNGWSSYSPFEDFVAMFILSVIASNLFYLFLILVHKITLKISKLYFREYTSKKFNIIKEVIDEWDPFNFLPHTPEDEYDSEISDITSALPDVKSVEQLAYVIHKVFVKWFGEDAVDAEKYSVEKCYPVAEKIWEKLF